MNSTLRKTLILTFFTASSVFSGCAPMLAGMAPAMIGGMASSAFKLDGDGESMNLAPAQQIPYQVEASNRVIGPADGAKLYGHY